MKHFILSIFLFFSSLVIAKTTHLKIQTSEGIVSNSLLHLSIFKEKLIEYTDEEMKISLFPKDTITAIRATSEAISKNALDGDFMQLSLLIHVHPVFGLIEDLMAEKRSPKEVTHFCMQKGGRQILQDIHDQIHENVYVVGCGSFYRDSFISTTSLSEVGGFRNLRVYVREGISKELFRLSGAMPTRKKYSYNTDVFNDLRGNFLDIAPESKMINHYSSSLPEFQRSYIFHAYHLMPLYQFTISKQIWDSLSDEAKKGLTKWVEEAFYHLENNASNPIFNSKKVDLDKSIFRNFVLSTWTSLLEENISYKDMKLIQKTYDQYALLEGEEGITSVKEKDSLILID